MSSSNKHKKHEKLFALVMERISIERQRQNSLVASGEHPFDVSDPMLMQGGDHALKFAVLGEEVGEVAKEVYELSVYEKEAGDPYEKLRTELTQVAAVAVAWLESLEGQ